MIRAWFDWRAIALALVLAVAAALPVMTTSTERRDFYFFDVTLTSTSPGTTQVFWDLGRGYTEYDSSRQPLRIEPKPVVYRYMMPMGEIKALRFDPIDGVGTFTLSHAQITDYRGKVVYKFQPSDFQAANDIARLETFGDTLVLQTTPTSRDAVATLKLPGGKIVLKTGARIWFLLGWPVAWKVFLAGFIIGLGPVASRLSRLARAIGEWATRRPRTAIALATILAVAAQSYPVVFLGRSFASPNNGGLMLYGQLPTLPGNQEYMYSNTMGSDTGALLFNHIYYPMMQRTALSHGELPLWNRYSLGGMPMLGQGQSGFGEPINFISILADGAGWAWDVRFLLAHWLFSAGLAFTAWRLTRHLGASILVAFGSAFIAFYTFRINHPATFSVCYSPLIVWAWVGLIQASALRHRVGWLAALITANWMVMTSGTVKEAYMTMVCLNLGGVVLLALLPDAKDRRWRVLGLATAAGAIFVLLSAPLWISFLVALRHSYTVYDAPSVTQLPLAHLIGFFDDMFYRQTNVYESVVAPALNFLLLLGVLWWLVSPRLWRADRAGFALILGGLLPLAMAFSIVPASLIMKMPFIGNIHHIGNTFSCPLMVITILLAGCGFRDAFERVREDDGWWLRFGAVLFAGAALLVAFFVSTAAQPKSPFFHGYAWALVLAVVALPLALRWSARTGRAGMLCVALAIALPLLLWRHGQHSSSIFNQYAFVPGLRSDLHAPSEGVGFIDREAREPGRRTGWGNSLFPAYNIALHWEGLYGVDTLRNRYYHELAKEFDMQRVWVWDYANKPEDSARLLPIHDLLNNDWYIADHTDQPVEIAGLKLVKQMDLDLYSSPTAWPRAFFTDRLGSYTDIKDFAALVSGGDRRPFAASQAGQTDLPSLPADLAGRTVRAASGYRLTANDTSFVIEAPGPGIAVLTEAYYEHDFRVTVNGKPAPYFRVNHAFKGVALPAAGRYEITFAYWPLYTTASLWLFAAGLALAGMSVGIVFLRTRNLAAA